MDIPAKQIKLIRHTKDNENWCETRKCTFNYSLFNIALEGAIHTIGIRKTISQSLKQLISYADNLAVIAGEEALGITRK